MEVILTNKILTYTNNGFTIDVNDLFTLNDAKVIVRELFTLNGEMYISYINDQINDLLIEKANDFIENNKNYFNSVVKSIITTNNESNCGCGCEN
jgi:hypothetical protein